MKRVSFLLMFATLFFTGCAEKATPINGVSDIKSNKFQEEMAYQRGYNKAKEELKDKYIEEGYNKAKEAFMAFKKDIQAWKAGMYADKEKLLTHTKIIGIDNGSGQIQLKAIGGEFRKDLSIDEILDFYAKHKEIIPIYKEEQLAQNTSTQSSSYNIESTSDEDNHKIEDVKPLDKVYQQFTKSYSFKQIIQDFNLNCQDRQTYYLCMFESRESLNQFCLDTGTCKVTK
jgi:hypothetical protein